MALMIVIGLALTLTFFTVIRRLERAEKQADFDYASSHVVEAIRQATERIEMTHEIVRADFNGSPNGVSREEFALCCEPCLAHVPSLKVLQWAPRISAADRKAFEQRARREGSAEYRIIEPNAQGKTVPAQQRDEYFPIWYASSKSGFQAQFGWDFAANPVLRQAIEKCRDTGRFVISEGIDLGNIGIDGTVLQTFMPVYRNPQDVHTISQRRANFEGVLVGLCRADDLTHNALNYTRGPQGVDLVLFDEPMSSEPQWLASHHSRTRFAPKDARAREAKHDPGGIGHVESLSFGGRKWSLVCTPAPYFFASHESWRSWTALVIGLLVTGVSGAYTLSLTTRTERIQRIVDERTAELRKKDDQLRQSQKLEAVGSLAGGIAHEFNNLLQAIGGYTRCAMEELRPEQQPYQDLENVIEAADRAATLTRQLLSFSRRETVERKRLDANQMVGDLSKMLRRLLGEQVQLKVLLGKDVGPVLADAGSFQQVLLNLCLNARDAMPGGGEIVIRTEGMVVGPDFASLYTDLKPGRYVRLSVSDTGHGMSPEVRERIFEPFFTTKPIGKGTGLGLSMVYGIVLQHEGAIHVYSEPDHGTTFKIYLPVLVEPEDEAADARSPERIGGHETILVAEDDPMVREITQRILQRSGYTVLAASDGEKALALFNAHREDIALVILDAIMPRLTGHEVYLRIKEKYPETRVIFCSGYDPETAQSNLLVDGRVRLVEKPYDPDVLLRTVREVLDVEELCPTS
jgi:signal transduction histidine kinase/CheY-like chemotaxis protein